MIVRNFDDLAGTDRDVAWGNGQSVRFLLEQDATPYTVTHTTVRAGSESHLCYEQHAETCYCITGDGEVVIGDETHALSTGVLYSLRPGEAHRLRAFSDLHLVCVFSPPLKGPERHVLDHAGHSSY
ncbi:MAG: ectoine synthase [Ilumatobacteraceae bacterium]